MRIHSRQALLGQALLASSLFTFTALSVGGAYAGPPPASSLPASSLPASSLPAAASATPGGPVASTAPNPNLKSMQQRVEQRIGELHTSLHVTAAQQPQWDAFVKVMRDNAANMDAVLVTDADALAKMTAVEQMQSYAKITDQHAKDMASLLPAFQGLYDAMSPEQKANADKYFRAQAERSRRAKPGKKAR